MSLNESLHRSVYYVRVLIIEALAVLILAWAITMCISADLRCHVDLRAFIEQANNLNLGLMATVFISVFLADNKATQQARKYRGYLQPFIIMLVNSCALCCLFLDPLERPFGWIDLSVATSVVVLVAANFYYTLCFLKICRFGWRLSE